MSNDEDIVMENGNMRSEERVNVKGREVIRVQAGETTQLPTKRKEGFFSRMFKPKSESEQQMDRDREITRLRDDRMIYEEKYKTEKARNQYESIKQKKNTTGFSNQYGSNPFGQSSFGMGLGNVVGTASNRLAYDPIFGSPIRSKPKAKKHKKGKSHKKKGRSITINI